MLDDSPHVRHEQRAALPCLGQQPEFEVIRAILPEIVYICDMDNSAHLQTVRRQPAVAGVPGPHVRIDECHTPNPINERAPGELGETPGCPCNFGAPNAPPPAAAPQGKAGFRVSMKCGSTAGTGSQAFVCPKQCGLAHDMKSSRESLYCSSETFTPAACRWNTGVYFMPMVASGWWWVVGWGWWVGVAGGC